MVFYLIPLRSIRANAIERLFFSISMNSGLRNFRQLLTQNLTNQIAENIMITEWVHTNCFFLKKNIPTSSAISAVYLHS